MTPPALVSDSPQCSDPVRAVSIYAVFAGLWILLSDSLLSMLFKDPETLALIGALKGGLFVLVTSGLLLGLLRRRGSPAKAATEPRLRSLLNLPFLVMAFAIVAIGMVAIAVTVQQRMRTETARLEAIASTKAEQVSDWLRDRVEGVPQILRGSIGLADLFKRWQAGETAALQQLAPRLSQLAQIGGFQAVSLVDGQGRTLWRSDTAPPELPPSIHPHVQRALQTYAVEQTGFYRGLRGNVRLDFVVALGHQSGAAVVLHVDPRDNLFPMLESWPAPSRSGEALLFRGEGQRAQFLSRLRQRPDAEVNFSLPLDDHLLLSSQALLAKTPPTQILSGHDYRGEPAFGVVRHIVGTDWLLLAKEDRAEALEGAIRSALWIGLACIFALGGLWVLLVMQRQRQQLLVAESTRQVQDERLQTLALLSAVVDHSEDCIFSLDREGRFTLFNPAAERLTGIRAEDALGHDEHAIFPAELATRLMAYNQRLMAEGISETMDEALPGKDGIRICVTSKSPLRDAAGKVVGLCGITRDITQREAIEARVRISEERLQLAMDAASDALWDWNLQTGLTFLSPRYYALSGYDPDDVTPDLAFLQRLVHPEDWQRVIATFEAHLRGETPSIEVDYRMVTRGGEVLWISSKGKVVARDADGQPLRMVGVASDITPRKQAETSLQTKSAELEARNAELERFNQAMIGRELDMIELKRQVNDLSRELGRGPPYSLAFAEKTILAPEGRP